MNIIISVAVFFAKLCKWIWKFLSTGVSVFVNLIFLSCLALVLFALFHQPQVKIPENSALVLAPTGKIVEQPTLVTPTNRLVNRLTGGGSIHEETLLQDIIDAVDTAAYDPRIKVMVLATDHLHAIRLDQIKAVGEALERFKQADKVIIARGNNFNQTQYYLASWADEVYLDPMGGVDLHGFGIYQIYMRDMLEKLAIDVNVFRAGAYKSAMEPFTRNDMSAAAKEANFYWLNNIWKEVSEEMATHRGLSPDFLTNAINNLDERLTAAQGDHARMALGMGLIDGIKSLHEFETYLAGIVGDDARRGFRQISFQQYLTKGTPTPSFFAEKDDDTAQHIGILVAEGVIVSGQGTVSQIGDESLMRQLRNIRKSDRIGALVLRLNSGGGSAFASEQIRRELLEIKKAGKPVVVSMGGVAASGGYWISTAADRIVASPVTLTGSIGVFGALPTFEETLKRLGVHGDGITTTTMADKGNPFRAMSPAEQRIFQLSVDRIYQQFIDTVAESRSLSVSAVEKIAQGRIWDGRSALENGLVDQLGTLNTAVELAADLAALDPEDTQYLHTKQSPFSGLLAQMKAQILTRLFPTTTPTGLHAVLKELPVMPLLSGDPAHIYAHSLLPETVLMR
ncbi:MAG: signal peptide peptidase SppA [Desulfobulbus propionicus]|nr:MAG: signal peptide peptidase SppA [Desulfobulbus propionicus]